MTITNPSDLIRDTNTNAIINSNKDNYLKAMKLKQRKIKEREEIESMKQDLSEIKILLQQLLKEKNG